MFTVHFMQVVIYSGEEEEAQESYILGWPLFVVAAPVFYDEKLDEDILLTLYLGWYREAYGQNSWTWESKTVRFQPFWNV